MPVGKRLGIGDVERRAHAARAQPLEERLRVDQPAPGGVDEQRSRLHPIEEAAVRDPVRLRGERQEQHDDIGRWKKPRQRIDRADARTPMLCDPNHVDPERPQTRLEGAADRAMPEDQDPLPLEVVAAVEHRRPHGRGVVRIHIPASLPLQLQESGQPALHGDDHGRAPLADRPVVNAARVADRDALRNERQQPFDARIERLHDLQPRQLGEERRQPDREVPVDDQHVDVRARAGHEAYALRERTELLAQGALRNKDGQGACGQRRHVRGPDCLSAGRHERGDAPPWSRARCGRRLPCDVGDEDQVAPTAARQSW